MSVSPVADGLIQAAEIVERGLRGLARELGNGGAATPMGAIEAHGAVIKELGEGVAYSIEEAGNSVASGADEIAAGLGKVADAINRLADVLAERD